MEIKDIKQKLENHEERIKRLENGKEVVSQEQELPGFEKGIKKLSKKISISEEKIKEIFDFENNSLTLTKNVVGGTKERTKNMTLIILIGYKYILGKNNILSQEIRRNVGINGIPINNFGTYLNEMMPSLISRKGKAKSAKTSYRLTFLGESKALETLKQLLK